MTTSAPLFPVYYLRQIADQLTSGGADAGAWLARHGLQPDQLSDTSVTLPFPAYHALLTDAVATSGEPALGLLVGARLPINTHGVLGLAAMSSSTLRQSVEMLDRFVSLRTPLVAISHATAEDGGALRLRIDPALPLGDIHQLVMEAVTLTVKNLLDFIAGARHIAAVGFGFPEPPYAALAQDLFQCEVLYGQQWTGFDLPPAVLDQPLKLADPTTFSEAAAMCQREFDRLRQPASMVARIRRAMLASPGQFPSLQVTARLFNCTPRTLHRRLLAEGTSFQQLLDQVRHRLACEHLKAGKLSVQEIAYALGYTEIANFRRAFKRWEGVPPSAFGDSARAVREVI
ncbi:AraC family transcriptional regulator [Pseudoduganella violaceinigra]|uniref:AraC family transcriptional regulator n=1 Tax=Pseudoduganella violaceinigra TaxID=246602 RepID=UPI0003FDC80F|nr:AraC family transcriptional regulator [Pseudoduganella violaceinigra]